MATPDQIRDALRGIAKNYGPSVSNIAKVASVNQNKGVCVLVDEDGQEYFDVRLRPVVSRNKSFIQVPKIGTYVLAIRIEDDDEWIVIACDEVESFQWTTEKSSFEVSDKLHLGANGKSMISLLNDLFKVIEKGYLTNNGKTTTLISDGEFKKVKSDFQELLK